jgi:hypothetical protein|tara:strand:- start:639 stop:860 length:222 start_codon:yes stop_codon:yes gene_type:complete
MRIKSNLEDITGQAMYIDRHEYQWAFDGHKSVYYTAYITHGDIELESFNYDELTSILANGKRNTTNGNLVIDW